jgi:cobalt/nickel transport system ATP-binding protein
VSHHLVSVQDLRFDYPDGTPALDGVSFTIHHGESVALVGANGAGKSTLLLHLAGAFFPRSGTVRVGDWPVTRSTLLQVRRSLGMVFQDADDQLFMPTVEDDVAFGPRNLGLPEAEVERQVAAALERVGAGHLRARRPHRLSSGEKRAAAIATVLAMGPSILVMDEPSASLDPAARRTVIEQLLGFEHTKIVASHDLDLVLEVCARAIVLAKGRVVADGPTARILADDSLLREARLERPLRLQGCPSCGATR